MHNLKHSWRSYNHAILQYHSAITKTSLCYQHCFHHKSKASHHTSYYWRKLIPSQPKPIQQQIQIGFLSTWYLLRHPQIITFNLFLTEMHLFPYRIHHLQILLCAFHHQIFGMVVTWSDLLFSVFNKTPECYAGQLCAINLSVYHYIGSKCFSEEVHILSCFEIWVDCNTKLMNFHWNS